MNRVSVASSSGRAETAERIAESPARASGGLTERIATASTGIKRSARAGCSAIASEICRNAFNLALPPRCTPKSTVVQTIERS